MLKASLDGLKDNWLQERFPQTNLITLGLRQIFIIPTVTSLALLIAILLMSLMAINFKNALVYALSFWLISLIVISIFYTFKNLSGLSIKTIQASPCFAGEKAVFELEVSCSDDQKKTAIFIGWKDEDTAEVDLHNTSSKLIKLSVTTKERGIFKPERLNIFTRYPIGLVVAWSYAQLDMQSIVYPEPKLLDTSENTGRLGEQAEQGMEIANGTSDFSSIREYQLGDSPRHIHWKSYAKTGKVFTKSFVDYGTHDVWLDWASLPLQDVEAKLSHLCARVLECYQEQQEFGLKLPNKTIQPASGEAHKHNCLSALALYGRSDG